jgi:hypothetical protein
VRDLSEIRFLSEIPDEEIAALRDSGNFDEDWYAAEYPDVRQSGIDPARHYLWLGRRLGRKPGPTGDVCPSLTGHGPLPELPTSVSGADADNAFVELTAQPIFQDGEEQKQGLKLNDKIRRLFKHQRRLPEDSVYDLVAEHFDCEFYLTTYPDVAAAGIDPIRHYLDAGWSERRDPSLLFSTSFYMESNPDVVAAGVNPFYHYHAAGKSEGRLGRHQLGFRWDILTGLRPVSEQISNMKSGRIAAFSSSITELHSALTDSMSEARELIVSISHDDFTKNVGGVQLLLRRELQLFTSRGDVYLHLFPKFPLPFLDTSDEEVSLGVIVNGRFVGFYLPAELCSALSMARPLSLRAKLVIHSLLGHNVDQIIEILSSLGVRGGLMWLHDYSPIYNNFKLLRNDVQYSGFPRPGTPARDLCEFARANFSHSDEFAKLLERFDVKLVSPSQAALDVWRDAGALSVSSEHVVEHVQLVQESVETGQVGSERPLRVGFLGYPAAHKGWPVFQELVLRFAGDQRYEFVHLGKGKIGGLNVDYREVSANENQLDAMRAAVASAELDIALLWSIWPETFCLTAYEAIAGGAFLIANPDSGNVVAVIEQTGQGIILTDEHMLQSAFSSGEVLQFARSSRAVKHYRMEYSSLSLELMD